MKAKVIIKKSFDENQRFQKEWSNGDFEKFFQEEGEYLDNLARTTKNYGKSAEGFEVTYTVTLVK